MAKSGDKYNNARGLSKLLEELISRIGDKDLAAEKMTEEVGPGWVSEMDTEDQGISFIPADLNLEPGKKPCPVEKEELYSKARKLASKVDIPQDNLEIDLFVGPELESDSDSASEDDQSISDLLRALADQLEK
jgi:hypothetical protein